MDTLKWYEELLVKTNGSDFDKEKLPDIFEVIVHNGDHVYAKWDIANELLENGMSRRNYTNASLNIDLELIFMHPDLREQLKEDESFKKMLEFAHVNDTPELNQSTSMYHFKRGGNHHLPLMEGVLMILIGLLGLVVKLKAPPKARVVKTTRMYYSVWCLTTGILMIAFVCSGYHVFFKPVDAAAMILVMVNSISSALLRVLTVSLKVFTVLIYIFQNTMVYRPFFFREHKKALSRWFLRMSLGQSAAIFIGLVVWSMILIYRFDDDCGEIIDRSHSWQMALISLTGGSYIGSFCLSIIFTVGYYRHNRKDIGKSQASDMKKTLLFCSIEILFDFSVLVFHAAHPISWLSSSSFSRPYALDLLVPLGAEFSSECDVLVRLDTLDGGLSTNGVIVLILQPTLQELIFLISELIGHCKKSSSPPPLGAATNETQ